MCTEELCTIIAASPLNVGQVICTTQAQLNCSKHTGDKSPSTFRCAIWRPLFYLTEPARMQTISMLTGQEDSLRDDSLQNPLYGI